jgi:hypothetical protein
MATLELVPLRSKFPYTGHMTVRYAVPSFDPETDSIDLVGDDLLDFLDGLETTTTPQVAGAVTAGETAVRKGVQAR